MILCIGYSITNSATVEKLASIYTWPVCDLTLSGASSVPVGQEAQS